jgi:hypothetical protein
MEHNQPPGADHRKSLLFVTFKQALGMVPERVAVVILTELLATFPSVVAVNLVMASDLHKMAKDSWVGDDSSVD